MLSKPSHVVAISCAVITCLALFTPRSAHAYPWMIRHHYPACSTCHYDPSGAGAITPYARVVADSVIRAGRASSDEASSSAAFLLGAVHLPDWLDLGGDVRLMGFGSKISGAPLTSRSIWMQLDGEATVHAGGFVASGTLGFAPEGALGAALTRASNDNLVSRQHWLGYQFPVADLFVRAGRMNLPFGVRTIEHTLWARKLTRTTINDDQQYGASIYFGVPGVRGELMAIAGNLQLRPDRYRERGYSAYLEAEPLDGLALGASSLITHRSLDTVTLSETWRQVHGLFVRWATPYDPLVVLGEWDYDFESSRDAFYRRGNVAYLQADWEPYQGSHFMATGEFNHVGVQRRYRSYGAWLSYLWFLAPHSDLRLDGIYQAFGAATGSVNAFTVLLQGHVFL